MTADPYCDPRTGVLYNTLGIQDAAELARVDLAIAKARDAELLRTPEPGPYDLNHLRRVHYRLFRDVYAWAGEVRTVAIARTSPFALPQFIQSQADRVFGDLAAEDCLRGLDRHSFVARVAYYLAVVSRTENDAASRESMVGNLAPLESMLDRIVGPL